MTLPITGTLALEDIQTEFGGTAPVAIDEYYRNGMYVTSNNTNVPVGGTIKISDFYGAIKQFSMTISGVQNKPNLRSLAISGGWNEHDALLITADSSFVASSDTTSQPALTINGSFPAGVIFINYGKIVGMGGAGGDTIKNGLPGGPALSVASNVTLYNYGTIAGGGGGGGAGVFWSWNGLNRSTPGSGGASASVAAIGGGGGPSVGGYPSQYNATTNLYSTPGPSNNWGYGGRASSPGGAGGQWGFSGDAGGTVDGNYNYSGYAGGAAGAAVTGNSFISWGYLGLRYGPIT